MVEKIKNKKIGKKVKDEIIESNNSINKKDSKSDIDNTKSNHEKKSTKKISDKDNLNESKKISDKDNLNESKKISDKLKSHNKKEKEPIEKKLLNEKNIKKSKKDDISGLDVDKVTKKRVIKNNFESDGDKNTLLKNNKKTIDDNIYLYAKDDSKKHKKSIASNINSDALNHSDNKKSSFIKNSFSDITLIYKNFFHWNISKLLIFGWSILLGLISVIPLIIIFFIYTFFSDVNISMLLKGMFTGTLLNNFFGNAILLFIVIFYFIFYSYGNILLINIYNGYLDSKFLSYKNNEYFNFKKIIKFFNLTLVNLLILFIPVLLFVILVSILVLFSGNLNEVLSIVKNNSLNYFSILSLIFLLINSVLFVYLFFRIIFSYFVFSDKNYYDNKKSVISYIKESFNKTKKINSFLKFLSIIVLLSIITFPIKIVSIALKNNVKILTDYTLYEKLSKEQKDYVTSTDPYYYQSLEVEFKGYTDSEINKKMDINEFYVLLFSIFSFLFISGLFVMLYSSFYRREL